MNSLGGFYRSGADFSGSFPQAEQLLWSLNRPIVDTSWSSECNTLKIFNKALSVDSCFPLSQRSSMEYKLRKSLYSQLNLEEEGLSRLILACHRIFFLSSCVDGFRKKLMVVFDDFSKIEKQGLYAVLLEKGWDKGKDKAFKAFVQIQNKVSKMGSMRKIEDLDFSDLELEVLRLLGYIPPNPGAVPKLMNHFEVDLGEKWAACKRGEISCDEVAAFAHQTFVDIHPFEDKNGTAARALADTILMAAGKRPVFSFYEKYLLQDVSEEARYLDAVKKTRRESPVVSSMVAYMEALDQKRRDAEEAPVKKGFDLGSVSSLRVSDTLVIDAFTFREGASQQKSSIDTRSEFYLERL